MKLCRGRICSRSCCSSCSSSGIIRERIDPLMLNIALKMGPKGKVVGTDRTLAHLLSNSSSGDLAGAASSRREWMDVDMLQMEHVHSSWSRKGFEITTTTGMVRLMLVAPILRMK